MRTPLHKKIAHGLVLVLCVGLAFYAQTLIDDAKTPKVKLAGSAVKLVDDSGHGSGVYLGHGLTLTAAHVAKDGENRKLVLDNGTEVSNISVLWLNETYDLALVQSDRIAATPAHLVCREPVVGEIIHAIGSPGPLDFVTTYGRVATRSNDQKRWKTAYVVDMTIVPGMSGGPVYDKSDNVIGVAVGVALSRVDMFPAMVGLGYVVPSSAVCHLLARA